MAPKVNKKTGVQAGQLTFRCVPHGSEFCGSSALPVPLHAAAVPLPSDRTGVACSITHKCRRMVAASRLLRCPSD